MRPSLQLRPPRRLLPALALAAVTLAGLGGCSGGGGGVQARPDGPRLTVLFAVCTLNRDYLAPYNPAVRYTPNFAALASAGVVFDAHYTEAGQSGTAYASLFSGCQADRHKIYTHPNELDDRLVLMAEAFDRAGWTPWYWYGHPMADPKLNYGQGVAPEHLVSFKDRPARLTPNDPQFVALLRDLAADPEAHAQVTVNFSYTHGPYEEGRMRTAFDALKRDFPDEVPMTYEEMERWFVVWEKDRLQLQWNFPETKERLGLSDEDVAHIATAVEIAYKSGVYMLDRHLGAFLTAVQQAGLVDELLLAFTADHGQVLFRDSALFQWTHGLQLAPEVLNVPLIVVAPKLLQPGRYAGVTRSIDVYPTLAGLSGAPVPAEADVQGVDLTPALLGEAPAPDLVAYSHSTTINPKMFNRTRTWTRFHEHFPNPQPTSLWVGARRGDRAFKWRTLDDGSWTAEVFDAVGDPEERTDLYDPADPDHAAMVRDLKAYKRRLVDGFSTTAGPADSIDRLRQLGYVDGEGEGAQEGTR